MIPLPMNQNIQNKLLPLTKPIFVQSYILVVRDLDMVTWYYKDAIGLDVLERAQNRRVLGTGGKALLILHQDKNAVICPKSAASLFHTAFLLPSRQHLAHYLKHAVDSKIYVDGASDHLVSEALYLNDPEGNGIEIYADRPQGEWSYNEDGVIMDTLPLNIRGLLSTAPDEPFTKLPPDTAVGHIHLQVGNLPHADQFYDEILGLLEIMTRYPGASFYSSGGYHHHIAANICNSRGAAQRPCGMTGLCEYPLGVDSTAMERITNKLDELKIASENTATSKRIYDPWGIGIILN